MTQTTRPDVDIEEDIRDLIAHYPPLQADRHHLRIAVQDGTVVLSGHVKSLVTWRYLVDRAAQVSGVYTVNSDQLYSEEMIRLEAGQRIPTGVIANVVYEAIVLTGQLPEGANADDIVRELSLIPGVERVLTKFD